MSARHRVLDVMNAPWAIKPEKLAEMRSIYLARLGDPKGYKAAMAELTRKAAANAPAPGEPLPYQVIDGVAVLEVSGILAKHMNLFMWISGGTSTAQVARDFQQALADPQVQAIVLNIDSPGGTVDGTQEVARIILAGREKKRIIALADGLMASAGYWIGSAAQEVYITSQTVDVGSIGVVATHIDVSKEDEMMGWKVTEITAGKYKRISGEHAPLSKEGHAYIQDQVDYLYSIFVDDVAKHRGVSAETVLEKMADGRIFIGQQAIAAGLADGEATLEQLIRKVNSDALINDFQIKGAKAPQKENHMTNNVPAAPPETPAKDAHLSAAGKGKGKEKGKAENDDDDEEDEEEEEEKGKGKGKPSGSESASYQRGLADGAKAERARIQGVESKLMPGHEELIQEMKFDGVTSPSQAAEKVLEAEQKTSAKKLNDLRTDAGNGAPGAPTSPAAPGAGDAASTSVEQARKAGLIR